MKSKRGGSLGIVLLIAVIAVIALIYVASQSGGATGKITAGCYDSDADTKHPNGINYEIPGRTKAGNFQPECYDVCYTNGKLKECYCDSNDQPTSVVYTCPNGCDKIGKCKP